jgi:catechol 2,3-dioxygenase-like lactoylglutathione lyase family enzyme
VPYASAVARVDSADSAARGDHRARIGSIVIRCHGFDAMLEFWQHALGYVPREPPEDGWVVLTDPCGTGPNVSLERVTEPLPPLGATSRVHLDLYTADQRGEVERLLALGATRYEREYRGDEDFVVLVDPDGNRFCVVEKPAAP